MKFPPIFSSKFLVLSLVLVPGCASRGPVSAAPLVSAAPVAEEQPVVKPDGTFRLATYNIEWLGEAQALERLKNLREVTKELNADIIGLQEVQSANAVKAFFDDGYTIAVPKNDEKQNLGIAVRKPFELKKWSMVYADAKDDFAFPGKRDLLHAVIGVPGGKTIDVFVMHFKSRRGGRIQTDPQREQAAALVVKELKRGTYSNAAVVGDFNDTPDDRMANIMESGDEKAKAGKDKGKFMVNLTEPLARADFVSLEVYELYKGSPIKPIAKGAYEDNERLRGKDYKYPDDVNVKQSFFDQILVTSNLYRGRANVFAHECAVRGVRSNDATRGLASDHCPVYADIPLSSLK